jgi:hypothetical protein
MAPGPGTGTVIFMVSNTSTSNLAKDKIAVLE